MMRRALCFSMGLFLAACNESTLMHSYKPLPLEGWDRRDTIRFDLPQVQKDISLPPIKPLSPCLTDAEGYTLARGVNTHQYETQQLPFHLKKGKQGAVRIHHLMANETLTGITEVGIKIETR